MRLDLSPKMSDHEQIAQVAHQKWANRTFFEQIAHSLIFSPKNERFAQKTGERIPNPGATALVSLILFF